jgi:RNA polymerase sigma-70 factor (ECF subfamily)
LTTGELQALGARPGDREEAALVARVADGDEDEALRAICARYAKPLFALGLRLLGDRGMAEEMVQDTFVRLWRSVERFDPERGSLRTFVYTLARRAAIDLRRRPASRPLTTADGTDGVAPAGTGADDFDRLVLGMAMRDALDSLSENHREALELQFREDLTQREVAERLGIPLGTVKTRTYHALRALKRQLEEREIAA